MENKTKRLSVVVSMSVDDYLTKRSEETGVSKSSLAFMMIEKAIIEEKAINVAGEFMSKLDEIKDLVEKKE